MKCGKNNNRQTKSGGEGFTKSHAESLYSLMYAKTNKEGYFIENAFLFAKLRQFKLLMKICERV